MPITVRQEKILNFLIDRYIQTALPVSSISLKEASRLGVSAATIRNDLQELAERGFITQFHISGGRIPTQKAYRLYVDNILAKNDFSLSPKVEAKIHDDINRTEPEPRNINKVVAQLVSELSDNLAIANADDSDDFFKFGLAGLFESPEFRELDRVFRITDIFEHFDHMFNQMEKEFFGDMRPGPISPFKVIIGKENPIRNIRDETVILAKYNLPQNRTGSLTVIGPMRMNYGKNLGLIQCVVREINNKTQNI